MFKPSRWRFQISIYHDISYYINPFHTTVLFLYPLQKQSPEVFYKKGVLEISQNSQENTCARLSFLIKLQAWSLLLYWKETLTQVFSCQFCEISKNIFFTEHVWTTASVPENIKLTIFWCFRESGDKKKNSVT